MRSPSRSSSSMAVMGDTFRRCIPLQHDLPPAMSALIAKLAALESNAENTAVAKARIRSAESERLREGEMA